MRNPGTGEATWRARLMGRAAEASANVPSALIIRLPVDPKETNQKLLKVSLRASYNWTGRRAGELTPTAGPLSRRPPLPSGRGQALSWNRTDPQLPPLETAPRTDPPASAWPMAPLPWPTPSGITFQINSLYSYPHFEVCSGRVRLRPEARQESFQEVAGGQ